LDQQTRIEQRSKAALIGGDIRLFAAHCHFDICHPVNSLEGIDAAQSHLFAPLAAAFPMGAERIETCITGQFDGGTWTASFGTIAGRFQASLFGIAPSGFLEMLRFGRFDRWEDGRIVRVILILDLPGLMLATGQWPLARPLGPAWSPAPATQDGVSTTVTDPAEGEASLKLVESMIAGLMRYDRQSLASMRMVDFWHPDFSWYGPGPIGSFQGLADYERGHARPFLTAFPDRFGGDHKCRIGERAYVASTGWPSVRATHSGGGWLGLPPTNTRISMRVMDLWRREGALLKENWVYIDIPDLLLQMGVDIFARAAELRPAKG